MTERNENTQKRWLARLQETLEHRRQTHVYRALQPVVGAQGPTLQVDGSSFVQFCTNNYLGLADHPEVVAAAQEALGRYGAGAGASRLVAGSMELHHELETALARFKGAEAALVCSTGFMANLAVLTTFAGPHDVIVSDKLNHASLIDAARFSGARHRTFPHRRYDRAEALLARPPGQVEEEGVSPGAAGVSQTFVVTDSVFSMDGDAADLPRLCQLAEAHGALVVIDEAHATGVLGEQGRGLAEQQGVEGRIALSVGTLSKAFGGIGGFICAARPAIEMLVNAARSFIYTTALPPACSAASLAALRIIQDEEGARRRARVMGLAAHVREELGRMGYACGASVTPIIPVVLGTAEKAVKASALLKERGVWVPAIRPPTVPPNSARLRISLMATHSDGQVEQLLSALGDLRDSLAAC